MMMLIWILTIAGAAIIVFQILFFIKDLVIKMKSKSSKDDLFYTGQDKDYEYYKDSGGKQIRYNTKSEEFEEDTSLLSFKKDVKISEVVVKGNKVKIGERNFLIKKGDILYIQKKSFEIIKTPSDVCENMTGWFELDRVIPFLVLKNSYATIEIFKEKEKNTLSDQDCPNGMIDVNGVCIHSIRGQSGDTYLPKTLVEQIVEDLENNPGDWEFTGFGNLQKDKTLIYYREDNPESPNIIMGPYEDYKFTTEEKISIHKVIKNLDVLRRGKQQTQKQLKYAKFK